MEQKSEELNNDSELDGIQEMDGIIMDLKNLNDITRVLLIKTDSQGMRMDKRSMNLLTRMGDKQDYILTGMLWTKRV